MWVVRYGVGLILVFITLQTIILIIQRREAYDVRFTSGQTENQNIKI